MIVNDAWVAKVKKWPLGISTSNSHKVHVNSHVYTVAQLEKSPSASTNIVITPVHQAIEGNSVDNRFELSGT